MIRALPRPVLVAHRWLGVVIGAVMTLWCLSGFVMMYVDYPRLSPADQAQALGPLHLPNRKALAAIQLPANTRLASARLEMMAGRVVLRIVPAIDPGRPIAQMRMTPGTFDLTTGKALGTLPAAEIRAIATVFGLQSGIAGKPVTVAITAMDQWTVQTFRRNQPLYRIDYADPAATTLYVAGNSGEAVQRTTRFQRFWNWLGAVPHWLYPTILRQNGEIWGQIVIWTSLTGCFLTLTGLWVGVARLRTRRDGTFGSPYKGLWWWHHMVGLVFGILTLTWVASGLFSMNPWGFLESTAGFAERERLAGAVTWGEVRGAILELGVLPAGTVRLESAPLGGTMFLVASDADGRISRFASDGRLMPLRGEAVREALKKGPPVASLELLTHPDAYYYEHKVAIKLPVWRAVLSDAGMTRLYIDSDSGQLIRALDQNGRSFRWFQDGLHRLDFPVLRSRPLWDIVVLPLLLGVTLVCGTGTWMGSRKLGRDLRRARRVAALAGSRSAVLPRSSPGLERGAGRRNACQDDRGCRPSPRRGSVGTTSPPRGHPEDVHGRRLGLRSRIWSTVMRLQVVRRSRPFGICRLPAEVSREGVDESLLIAEKVGSFISSFDTGDGKAP